MGGWAGGWPSPQSLKKGLWHGPASLQPLSSPPVFSESRGDPPSCGDSLFPCFVGYSHCFPHPPLPPIRLSTVPPRSSTICLAAWGSQAGCWSQLAPHFSEMKKAWLKNELVFTCCDPEPSVVNRAHSGILVVCRRRIGDR